MPISAAPTVRESLEAAVETVVPEDITSAIPAQETLLAEPSAPAAPEAKGDAPAQESEAEKAERLRNKDGTFAKGKSEPKEAAKPAEPAKPKAPRPTSWRKDLEPQWDLLTPELQAYVQQREKEYQTGVSTYKTEADRASKVMQAVSRFEPILQQHGIPIDQWITNLGNAHHQLSLGSPQDKVNLLANIIRNNGIDANALFQVLSGQQPTYQPQQPQPQINQQEIEQRIAKTVEQKFMQQQVDQQYKAFTEAVNTDGTPKYPHFEAVRDTMSGLLNAMPSINDYPSAYAAALRMPQHADLWEADQKQVAATKEAERAAAEAAKVGRARSQAVSVKSSTPSAMTQTQGPKGLRDNLSENFDSVTARRV